MMAAEGQETEAKTPVAQLIQLKGEAVVQGLDRIWEDACRECDQSKLAHFLRLGEASPQAAPCILSAECEVQHMREFLAKLVLYAPEEWFEIVTGCPPGKDVKNDFANIGVAFDASSRLRRAGVEYYHNRLTHAMYSQAPLSGLAAPAFYIEGDRGELLDIASLPIQKAGFYRVVAVSDTHLHEQGFVLPAGDVLVHAGDLSYEESRSKDRELFESMPCEHDSELMRGLQKAGLGVASALKWLAEVSQFEHRILVGGNHDFILEALGPARATELCKSLGIHYLHTDAAPLTLSMKSGAKVTAWGTGISAASQLGDGRAALSGNVAFQQVDVDGFLREKTQQLQPGSIDILVTHGAPQDLLLGGKKGPAGINSLIERLQPALFVCGHSHNSRDLLKERFHKYSNTLGINAACLGVWNHRYGVPVVVDIPFRPRT